MTHTETMGNEPGESGDRASHRQVIARYWVDRAAIGLQGYRRECLGAAVVPTGSVAEDVLQTMYGFHAILDQMRRQTGSCRPSDEIARRIHTDNPEAQIVGDAAPGWRRELLPRDAYHPTARHFHSHARLGVCQG